MTLTVSSSKTVVVFRRGGPDHAGLMSATTEILAGGSLVVSAWAAWTAHGVRRWQRQRDLERLQTRVAVEFEHASGPRDREGKLPPPIDYVLTVIVRNDGETTEYLSDVFVQEPKPDDAGPVGYHAWSADPGADRELRPRARTAVPVPLEMLRFDVSQGFVGIARLASGIEIRSELEHLMNDLVE